MAFAIPAPTDAHKTPGTAPLAFIMADPALSLCPGLFRQLNTADQEDLAVELRIAYTHGDTLLRVRGPLLSGYDLAILQAIEMVAKSADTLINADTATGTECDLLAAIRDVTAPPPNEMAADVVGDADDDVAPATMVLHSPEAADDMCYASCSVSSLLRAVGLPTSAHYVRQAIASLERLAAVTLYIGPAATPTQYQALRLLSQCRVHVADSGRITNHRAHMVHLALHPRLTRALVGVSDHDTRMSTAELRALGTNQAARVLHQRLCAIINDGAVRSFKAGTLIEYLYPSDLSGTTLDRAKCRNAQAAYDHRQRKLVAVWHALQALSDDLGWSVTSGGCKRNAATTMDADTTIDIARPEGTWTYRRMSAAKQAAA